MTVHKIHLFTIALMLMTPSFSTSGPDSHDGAISGRTGHPQVHTTGGPASNPDATDARSTLDRLTLMPLPNGPVTPGEGRFRVDEHFALAVQGKPDARIYPESTRLIRRLAGRTGLFLPQDFIRKDTDAGSTSLLVRVERPGKLELHEDESYRLSITSERIRLDAATDLGALHGFETILQLLDADADGYFFPAIELEDEPRFPWRGLMIDAARHFMPVDVIKRNLDGMAAVKLNVFHWHLTEDQGFRVESKTKPLLHEKGSDGEYYTREEIRDIIRYADQRGIRVVPEFDIPGHATSWLVGHPELASMPGPYEIERGFGIFDPTLDPTREEVYEFLDVFLGEMAALFPDDFMHIGGDEVTGRHWDENPDIQQFMRENEIPDNQALQAYFNSRVMDILEKHGKIMVGWEEILHPDLPQDIVIQSWYGRQSMVDAARQGYQSILSHGYYIDLIQPTDLHYVNNPLPPDTPLNPEEQKLILGGEAPMWSEYVSWETIDSRIWPRTAAIAEVFWSVDVPTINLPSGREWFIPEDLLTPEIVARLDDMYRRLEAIRIQLEEHGLTHDRNYPVMLRRLAGDDDITAVKTFVDVVEPVKIYNRPRQRRHTSYYPLTRTVDAARPDAMTARQFRRLVDDYLDGGAADREMAAVIRGQLLVWRDNHSELEKVIRRSPILAEIETLSEDLARLSAVGIEALDNILEAQRSHPDWKREAKSAVEAAREPRGQVEIMIVPAVQKLILASAGE